MYVFLGSHYFACDLFSISREESYHLEAAYHIFRYFKKHLDMGCLTFDPKAPDINEQHFYNNANWKEFYGDIKEELLPNMPEPWGHLVSIKYFCIC